jgi:hypothetical protein
MGVIALLATFLLTRGLASHPLTGTGLVATNVGSSPQAHGSDSPTPQADHGQGPKAGSGHTAQAASSSPPHYRVGPLLASTPYGQVAYQVFPGPLSSAATQAIDGFSFRFTPLGPTEERVRIYVAGQGTALTSQVFPRADRLYFIETSFGDDAPATDLNGGDDGIIMTDQAGHILQ